MYSMRKRIIGQGPPEVSAAEPGWMDLESLAQVEITSEEVGFPIEAALIPGTEPGWRAAQPGEQTIRLLFDEPLQLRRLQLAFHEEGLERTQEFVLRWSPDRGRTFSPPGATREIEDYTVELDGVTGLELKIVPDISGGSARASLARLRVA